VAHSSVGAEAPPPLRAQAKPQFEFVLRDSEESEFANLVDFGGAAPSVENVVRNLLATTVWNYVPPKNGEIALLLATNGECVVKCVTRHNCVESPHSGERDL